MTRPPSCRRSPLTGALGFLAVTSLCLALPACRGAATRPSPTATPPAATAPAGARAAAGTDLAAASFSWLPVRAEFVASPSLLELESKYRAATDVTQRRWALAAAAQLGESRAVVWLAQIAATDPKLASAALDALATVKGPTTAPQLGDIAASSGPVAIRVAAIRALAGTADLAQIVQLTVLVADPTQPMKVRQQAATALGRLRRDEALTSLARVLDETAAPGGSEVAQLRAAAIRALERIDTPEAHAVLDRHLERDPPATRRTMTETVRDPRH